MDRLPHGTRMLKDLLRMSWRSLILMAVADAQQFFSPAFLAELEPSSPFRFDFLRARNQKLAGRQSLYAVLFDAFLEAGADSDRGDEISESFLWSKPYLSRTYEGPVAKASQVACLLSGA